MKLCRLSTAAGALAAAACGLAALAPPGRLRDELTAVSTAPQATADALGADAVALSLVGVLAWAALAWLIVAGTSVAAGALPGRLGRVATRVSGAVVPAAARRLLAGLLGVALLTGIGAAAHADPVQPPRVAAVAQLDLDWPVTAPRSPLAEAVAGKPANPPAPATPSSRASPPGESPLPVVTPRQTGAEVVVLRGDSLWSIAKAHLGAHAGDREIAAEWPRWWAANRAVVGDDPDLLLPDQRLGPPDPRR